MPYGNTTNTYSHYKYNYPKDNQDPEITQEMAHKRDEHANSSMKIRRF